MQKRIQKEAHFRASIRLEPVPYNFNPVGVEILRNELVYASGCFFASECFFHPFVDECLASAHSPGCRFGQRGEVK